MQQGTPQTPPQIEFTDRALGELALILEHDHTVEGKVFRIHITGKGCDGFTYSVGFTDQQEGDTIIETSMYPKLKVVMDSFTAHYLTLGKVDFVMDLEADEEGFTVTNFKQEHFKGKFWLNKSDQPNKNNTAGNRFPPPQAAN